MGFRKSQEIVIFNTKKVMMKANEIRVGNWINDPRQYDPKFFPKTDNGYFRATARDIQYAEDFEPIPLTEEILLKCGGDKYIDNGKINIDLEITKDLYLHYDQYGIVLVCLGDELRKIYYLHQVQNLYWCLVGEELEINL